jgi:hypothetical protein
MRLPFPWRRPRRPKKRHVVYTCLFGYSEQFGDYSYEDESVDYVCFTDDPDLRSSHWDIRLIKHGLLDSHRLAKLFKHLPHRYFPEYERSLYIDNTVRLKKSPSQIFDIFHDDLSLLKHQDRDCVYDEAAEVIKLQFDDPIIINRQMDFYRSLGYPRHNGLNACTLLVRNHHSPALAALNETWHTQVLRYSKRDQLSWNVCAWWHRFHYHEIDENPFENPIFEWPIIKNNIRLPRDFDDIIYLAMHPDVKASGMNPRLHYIRHGHLEGRPYKF